MKLRLNKPLTRLTKKQRTQIKPEIKKRYYHWYHRNINDPKRLLGTVICQQIWPPRKDGKIPRNIQPTKTEPGRKKIWTDWVLIESISNQKPPNKQKSRSRWLHYEFF